MPWIILTMISLVLDLINIIRYLVHFYFLVVGPGIVFFALAVYLFIVVWSYRF